jgi:hypothetical protein
MNDTRTIQSWNRQHPAGTHVIMQRPGKLGYQTTTRSKAFLSDSGHAMILLNGMAVPCELESLHIAEIKGKGFPR